MISVVPATKIDKYISGSRNSHYRQNHLIFGYQQGIFGKTFHSCVFGDCPDDLYVTGIMPLSCVPFEPVIKCLKNGITIQINKIQGLTGKLEVFDEYGFKILTVQETPDEWTITLDKSADAKKTTIIFEPCCLSANEYRTTVLPFEFSCECQDQC